MDGIWEFGDFYVTYSPDDGGYYASNSAGQTTDVYASVREAAAAARAGKWVD